MTYEEALKYIHGVSWRGSRLGLSRTRELLKALGDPQDGLKFIHVAGTNGKGSVCAMLASVLSAAGYKTGLYTSPYILRFNERIQVDGEEIPDGALAAVTDKVKRFADRMSDPPTEFELVTAIGFEYFKQSGCDYVVLEVGMGGELDSTNVIKSPVLAIITEVGLDHTKELGATVAEIARTKAGIIKDGCPVVSYNTDADAATVITAVCKARGARLSVPDFAAIKAQRSEPEGISFEYAGFGRVSVSLCAGYQSRNAAAVLCALDELRRSGVMISDAAIRAGLGGVKWRGRFEKLGESPTFTFDGGHNPNGVRAARKSFETRYPGVKPVVLLGIMADKDYRTVIDILVPLAESFVAVRPDNPRALDAETLCAEIERAGGSCVAAKTVAEGIALAKKAAGADGSVLALGSLYMYAEIVASIR